MNETQEKFEAWAVVELFGHQRIAGKVSEQTIGGCSFLRVDVPAAGEVLGFTKFFGNGAIYAMTPCTEEIARAAAGAYRVVPISHYDIPELRQRSLLTQSESRPPYDYEDED